MQADLRILKVTGGSFVRFLIFPISLGDTLSYAAYLL